MTKKARGSREKFYSSHPLFTHQEVTVEIQKVSEKEKSTCDYSQVLDSLKVGHLGLEPRTSRL